MATTGRDVGYNDSLNVVHEGWLTKSPPEKRIWKSKWRQRYFVLKQGLLPGQYLLEYFEDINCKRRRGVIDLDECQQVDAGLQLQFESNGKASKYVFDIKTPRRLYYLATKTEEEMKRWVDAICNVCGLRIRDDDSDAPVDQGTNAPDDYRYSPNPSSDQSNGNNSNGTSICTSNGTTTTSFVGATGGLTRVSSDLRGVTPPEINVEKCTISDDGDNPYIPISECRSGSLGMSKKDESIGHTALPPPRPPKPASLRRKKGQQTDRESTDSVTMVDGSPDKVTSDDKILTMKVPIPKILMSTNNNEEIQDKSEQLVKKGQQQKPQADQMYSFPKPIDLSTHIRSPSSASSSLHQYFNAAPGRLVTKENIFNYDFTRPSLPTSSTISFHGLPQDNPSDRSPVTSFSGLLQPPAPPMVHRELKPRKQSRSSASSSSPKAEKQRRDKCGSGSDLQYLDLDLDSSDGSSPRTPNMDNVYSVPNAKYSPARESAIVKASSVYKEVDFVRTDALSRMKRHEGS